MQENCRRMKYLLISDEFPVAIRNIEDRDAELLMELNNDIEISHYVVGNPRIVTLDEQMLWLEKIKTEKNCQRFIVEYQGVASGTLIVSNIDTVNLTANLSIKLHKNAQGKGIGKQSIKLMVKYCFEFLKLECLTAHVLIYNQASLALFRSCNFTNEGILKSRVIKDGKRCDLVSFSITKDDFR